MFWEAGSKIGSKTPTQLWGRHDHQLQNNRGLNLSKFLSNGGQIGGQN